MLSLLFLLLSSAWIFLNVYSPLFEGPFGGFEGLGTWDFDMMGFLAEEGMEGEHDTGILDFGDWVDVGRNRGDSYMFLIIGRDDGLLTDMMMLMHFNVRDGEIGLLSIPRDGWINNNVYRGGRINAAYAAGFNAARRAGRTREEADMDGINFLRKVIQFTFGLPIDAYIHIDIDAFKLLVDAVDGVYMDVPVRMVYNDPCQNLHINIQPGWQRLDGVQAEGVVRYRRGYIDADIGRIRTQQRFLAALARQMLVFDVPQIRRISEVMTDNVTTNLSVTHMLWFAAKVTEVGLDNIIMHTLPGEPARLQGGASVWSLYRAESMQIINGFYNPHIEDIPESNFNIIEISRRYGANPQHINLDGVTMAELINN